MRNSNFKQLLNVALDIVQGYVVAAAGIELRALTITGREVSMPLAAGLDRHGAHDFSVVAAAWQAWLQAVRLMPGVVAPRGCPAQSAPAVERVS